MALPLLKPDVQICLRPAFVSARFSAHAEGWQQDGDERGQNARAVLTRAGGDLNGLYVHRHKGHEAKLRTPLTAVRGDKLRTNYRDRKLRVQVPRMAQDNAQTIPKPSTRIIGKFPCSDSFVGSRPKLGPPAGEQNSNAEVLEGSEGSSKVPEQAVV